MTTKSHFSKYVIFLIIVITFPTLSFAAAGKVAFVLGQVDKKDENGVIFSVNKQTIFESSDIIITKKNGQLMLIMADKSKITIRPNTTFHIKDYSYRGDTKTDKSHYNLVKGGFRYVTGKMGKTNKSSFKLKTAIGTIGIRGTDFEANLCDQNCDNDKGLFVNVVSGGVSLNNSGGSINVEPGKIGHIESSTLTPTPTNKLPDIMTIGDSTKTNTKHATSEEQIVSIALRKYTNI
ncbi:MAG: FecR family protein [Gammaproteobacteria bacterium]|nr:FecR family protein [Gammaproteobacteria bacterium]